MADGATEICRPFLPKNVCLTDRCAPLPPFPFPVISVVLDESEYAHSSSLLRLISRGRQRVILHG